MREIVIFRTRKPNEGEFMPEYAVINARTKEVAEAWSALGASQIALRMMKENSKDREIYGEEAPPRDAEGFIKRKRRT